MKNLRVGDKIKFRSMEWIVTGVSRGDYLLLCITRALPIQKIGYLFLNNAVEDGLVVIL